MGLRQVGRRVALEHDWGAGEDRLAALAHFAKLPQVDFALLIRKPDHLEEMVPLGCAIGVVVDGLAGGDSHLAARLFSARIKSELTSLHWSAIRTAIWPSVLRARVNAPPRLCEPSGRARRTLDPPHQAVQQEMRPPERAYLPRRRTPETRRPRADTGKGRPVPRLRCDNRSDLHAGIAVESVGPQPHPDVEPLRRRRRFAPL